MEAFQYLFITAWRQVLKYQIISYYIVQEDVLTVLAVVEFTYLLYYNTVFIILLYYYIIILLLC